MKKFLSVLKNSSISLFIIAGISVVNYLLRFTLDIKSMVPMLYVLGVFLISICTEGYFYGIMSSVFSAGMVLAFFCVSGDPLNFKLNIITSSIIIFLVAVITCTMTTYIKRDRINRRVTLNEHMKANLMRAISHDLRTPLTSIYGSSSAILDNYDTLSAEQRLDLVREIKEESNGLIHMVENLLLVTKVSDEGGKLTKAPAVLEEVIDAVAVKFGKHFPEVNLEIDIPDEFIIIPMDAMLIVQVINNLLENAVFHAKGMTRVILKVTATAEDVLFEVIDDGCGIPKENLTAIFKGYLSSVTELRHATRHNMGIGLSVCAAIIKAHDSEIYAVNNELKGATFRFKLSRGNEDE